MSWTSDFIRSCILKCLMKGAFGRLSSDWFAAEKLGIAGVRVVFATVPTEKSLPLSKWGAHLESLQCVIGFPRQLGCCRPWLSGWNKPGNVPSTSLIMLIITEVFISENKCFFYFLFLYLKTKQNINLTLRKLSSFLTSPFLFCQ